MSGGVDSAVAMRLLKEQGHDVTAFYLKIWLEDELAHLGHCPWEEDLSYLEPICAQAGVKLEILPLQREYWRAVIAEALAELRAGGTPNPDLLCNRRIKFGAFFDYLDRAGVNFDLIASGHYARSEEKNDCFWLKTAKDTHKDQTYFLARLSQEQLRKIIFPIGDCLKTEVRRLAAAYDLPNQKRKDSQGLCFLGKIQFSEFVRHHLGEKQGDLIDYDSGGKVGEHRGHWFYTPGQRRGIGLSGGPWFVVCKEVAGNRVYVSRFYQEGKPRDCLRIQNRHWVSGEIPADLPLRLRVKLRHGEKSYGVLAWTEESDEVACLTIDGQDQGIAAGQFAVFYRDDYCLGCARIL